EPAERPAGHHRLLCRPRLAESALGVDEDVGAQARVEPLDALEHGARDLDGRERPAADQLGKLDGRCEAEIRGVHRQRLPAPASWSASASRGAVNGWRPAMAPSGARASATAFEIAAEAPITPPSAIPFMPSGVFGSNRSTCSTSSCGTTEAVGNA